MQVSVTFFPDLRTAYVRFLGDVTFPEMQAMLRARQGDPAWEDVTTVISDHRFARMMMTGEEVRAHARQVGETPGAPDLRQVVAIHPSDLGFGLARMFQTLSQNTLDASYTVVRTVDEALAQLGVDEARLAALRETLDAA